jgi:hypothetical protein
MTDDSIEAKALALLDEMAAKHNRFPRTYTRLERGYTAHEALFLAIEQHEAFKQEVSDIVEAYVNATNVDDWEKLKALIIPKPKPDPLVEVMKELVLTTRMTSGDLRAVLEARGLEIREKGQ